MPVILVLLLAPGPLQATAPDGQALRGVVGDQTGAVLQGARVELVGETGQTAHSLRGYNCRRGSMSK